MVRGAATVRRAPQLHDRGGERCGEPAEDEVDRHGPGRDGPRPAELGFDGQKQHPVDERGASVFWAGREAHMPARKIEVVDVIGAGDALCAGYLSARLDGLDPGAALARGVDVAAACVGSAGDWEGLSHRHVD
ncbi:carbohydrate kinase family protein [Propioniciclava sinopodophylli]|nr:PfkB family carbohydrate kinase [Propioniciclava sinopodophylli]